MGGLYAFHTTFTSELLESPTMISSSCRHNAKLTAEVERKEFEPEELIRESLNHFEKEYCSPSFLIEPPKTRLPTSWSKDQALYVFQVPWTEDACFFIDLCTGEAFNVDDQSDNLTEQEIIDHREEVDAADRKLKGQFVREKLWKCVPADSAKYHPIDAIWLRKPKWYYNADGTKYRKINSRLCAKCFLDAQGMSLTTRATTATRLSQRFLVALPVIFGFDLETWDASGAFLKGFPFKEVEHHLRMKG